MLLLKLTFLLVVLATTIHCRSRKSNIKSNDYDDEDLVWPNKYAFEITKYNIASGLVEDIKVWKTKKESRVEYNQGAVKTILTKGKPRGYLYEVLMFYYDAPMAFKNEGKIHPESLGEDEMNEIVCHASRASRFDSPTDVLPDTDDFEFVDREMMGGEECSKYYKETKEEKIDTRETLWAYYDDSAKAWVPVRYELEQFNNWLGNIDRHDLWEFESFSDDFDEKTVFDVSDICDSKRDPIRHEMHDEAVTKHLLFIDPENKDHVDHVFKAFKKNHNINYAHKDEHAMRKRIFEHNLRLIKSTNRRNLGYKLAVNQFSDRTPEEMKRHMGLMRRPEGKKGLEFPYDSEKLEKINQELPAEYDLRLEGIISPVQNQESCGSCWTFGTTSAVEGALARNNGGKLIRLSNQALIDCAWEFGAGGCGGGTDNAAYEWMMKYGLPKISEYGTYTNEDGFCKIENMTETYPIKGFVDVSPNSIQALKVALVNHGPLSVSVHVTEKFVVYSGGIFYDFECDPTSLNHEITLVGYGEQYGETFWIVKNSWGQDWGIDGFMHIAAKDNNCGIMTEPTYVLL